jgi:hypothetical protein
LVEDGIITARDRDSSRAGFLAAEAQSFAKNRFICVSNNFACLSPNQYFREQNSILA